MREALQLLEKKRETEKLEKEAAEKKRREEESARERLLMAKEIAAAIKDQLVAPLQQLARAPPSFPSPPPPSVASAVAVSATAMVVDQVQASEPSVLERLAELESLLKTPAAAKAENKEKKDESKERAIRVAAKITELQAKYPPTSWRKLETACLEQGIKYEGRKFAIPLLAEKLVA